MTTYNTIKYTLIYTLLALSVPFIAFAQFNTSGELSGFGDRILTFISSTLVPFVLALALLFFIYGIYLFFIAGATEEEKRKEGRKFLLWSIIAFVIIVSVWGIVNLLSSGLGLDTKQLERSNIPIAAPQPAP